MTTTTLTDRWDIRPQHPWLRGRRPDVDIRFDEGHGVWEVFSHAAATQILGDPATFSVQHLTQLIPEGIADPELSAGDLTQMDGPEHRKLRRLVSHAFTPRTVADLEPRIDRLTRELLDAVADRDQIELVADLAYPLPVTVISELLGIPSGDRDLFREMVDRILNVEQQLSTIDSEEQRQFVESQADLTREGTGFLREHVAERRRKPREDLLTRLVEAEIDGERLTDTEVTNFALLLFGAGHITTTMLLGNTLLCLDDKPEQAARVRADRALVPTAIEESLRFLSPIAATYRATTTDVEVAGQLIPRDSALLVWFSAANRDPNQFDRPDEFDAARDPNPHLGFGRGVHFCLGAPLARLEGRIALNLLMDYFPTLRTDPGDPPDFMAKPDFLGVQRLALRTRE